MRADRLLQIMILLQNRGKMTAKELAQMFEVSERTILRDMDALSAAGVPVFSERGADGGWRLLDTFKNKLSGLAVDDLKTLLFLPSSSLLKDLGIESEGSATKEKILASVPQHLQRETKSLADKIHIDTNSWRGTREQASALHLIQKALLEEKKIHIHYKKPNGEKAWRLVEPLGLVAQSNKWYLVALHEGEFRHYRVSRIEDIKIEVEKVLAPEGFNLANYWSQSKKDFIIHLPEYKVFVELDPTILHRLTFTNKFIQFETFEANEKDWIPAEIVFNTKQEALEFILGFADKLKIVTPEGLSSEIVALAERVVEFYKNSEEEKS